MDVLGTYIKDDLKVYWHHAVITEEVPKERIAVARTINYYQMIFMLKGSAVAEYNNRTIEIEQGQMIFADIGTVFSCNFLKKEEIFYINIVIDPSVLNEKSEDEYFLRGLQSTPVDNRVITFDQGEYSHIGASLNQIINCLKKHLGRPHILPRIKSIISDIDMIYDENFADENKSTDNISVLILQYVKHHFNENITDDFICNKFFVSKPTLRKIFRVLTNMTMREYIERLRMDSADNLLQNGYDVMTVSDMCGYWYYTTFLNAYKKHFNKLPSEGKSSNSKGFPLKK